MKKYGGGSVLKESANGDKRRKSSCVPRTISWLRSDELPSKVSEDRHRQRAIEWFFAVPTSPRLRYLLAWAHELCRAVHHPHNNSSRRKISLGLHPNSTRRGENVTSPRRDCRHGASFPSPVVTSV